MKIKSKVKGLVLTVALASSLLASTTTANAAETVRRIDGNTRFDTATSILDYGWKEKPTTVIIAGADAYADALAGTVLAEQLNAPILLSRADTLRKETLQKLKDIKPSNVILLGGDVTLSAKLEKEVQNLGIKTKRLDGKRRFETAEAIADALPNPSKEAILVNSHSFADALSIAPFADGRPIYLTRGKELTPETERRLKKADQVYIIGGDVSVSSSLDKKFRSVKRLDGATRYETNLSVLSHFKANPDKLFVATGTNFPDALTGGALAAKEKVGLLLTRNELRENQINYLNTHNFSQFAIFGGPVSVPNGVQNKLASFIKTPKPVDNVAKPTPKPTPTPAPKPVVTTKTETIKESIAYKTVEQKSDKLPVGKKEVKTKGVNGQKEKVYSITYTNGKETSRKLVSESIKTQPINEVVLIGTNTDPDVADRNPETGAFPSYPFVRKSDGREISMPDFDYSESDIDGLIKFIKEHDKHGIISYGFEENYTPTHIKLININPSFRRREKQFNITFSDPEKPGRSLVVGPYTEQYNELVAYFDGTQDVMPQYGLRAGDQLRYDDFGHRILYLQPISGRTVID